MNEMPPTPPQQPEPPQPPIQQQPIQQPAQPVPQPPVHPYTAVPGGATKRRSNKAAIWIVAAVIALVFTVAMVWNVATNLQAQNDTAQGTSADGESQGGLSEEDDAAAAQVGPFGGVEWPANMATGGIIFTSDGKGGMQLSSSDAQPVGTPGPTVDRGAGDRIVIYSDMRCPHCSMFESENNEMFQKLVESGDASVELRYRSFFDNRPGQDTRPSARLAGAVACLANEGSPDAWKAHMALLASDFQESAPSEGHSNADIITAIETQTGQLDSGARSCIESEQFVPFMAAYEQWSSSTPIPDALQPDLVANYTPFVLVNGEEWVAQDVPLFADFLKQQGVKLP